MLVAEMDDIVELESIKEDGNQPTTNDNLSPEVRSQYTKGISLSFCGIEIFEVCQERYLS
jgi:hypothetical protein